MTSDLKGDYIGTVFFRYSHLRLLLELYFPVLFSFVGICQKSELHCVWWLVVMHLYMY